MPRYTLSQLVGRANAGQIGRRGLRRLEQAGLNPAELGQSGVASPLQRDPMQDLAARRETLYGRAVQAASALPQGQTLSAGLQRRLQLGAGGDHSATSFAPHSAQEVQHFGEDNVNTILDAIRKRRAQIGSSSAVYGL